MALRFGARRTALRLYSTSTKSPLGIAFSSDDDEAAARYRTQKNPVVPSLSKLSTRWLKMDHGQQDDIIAYLEDKMRGNWHELTADEKRAAWFVWFGPWGPRMQRGKRDLADIYTYLAGMIGLSTAGLALYKYSTFDCDQKLPGEQ